MSLNGLLNTPQGRMYLQGSSRRSTYAFRIVREGPKGTTSDPAVDNLAEAADINEQKIPRAVLEKWNEAAKEAAGVHEDVVIPDTEEPTEQ